MTPRMVKITDDWSEIHYEDNPDFVPKWSAPNFAEHGMLPEHADAASEVVVFEKLNKRGEPIGLYKAICPCCKKESDLHGLALHPYWMFDLDWLETHGQRNRFACTGCRPLAVVEDNGIRKSQMMEALGAPEHFLAILREDEADPGTIVD